MAKRKRKLKPFITGFVGSKGEYYPTFQIGVQGFRLHSVETQREARWYAKMLRIAFTNLIKLNDGSVDSQDKIKASQKNFKKFNRS